MSGINLAEQLISEANSATVSGSEIRRNAARTALLNSGIIVGGRLISDDHGPELYEDPELSEASVLQQVEYIQSLVTARTFELLGDS